jgi:hypothetical protein
VESFGIIVKGTKIHEVMQTNRIMQVYVTQCEFYDKGRLGLPLSEMMPSSAMERV